ncbi:hypothetical protein [Hymenobacter psychrotolerans]|uniref:Uncharacterized protein n=1 Tax=Hymenobacter psychrotolerans DSM 18569 TaxID=1121959 RepID=A0A1M7E608_9BACT|nr:hypothetical protein [Hymenobacter psychrotolerans]SHL87157.1 hypothetical protein SAMN02746009_03527 [Hymenobacter psychrotolerans DSM 18569]
MSSPHPLQLRPLGGCLLRWHQAVDALWQQTPTIQVERTITRGVRAGVQETIVRRGRRLVVDGCKATGELLLKQYRRAVERMLAVPFLFGQLVTDTGEYTLPSILVDARQLMLQRSLTERTMRNHLRQLLDIGFIVRKKWHGRKRSFELWINPDFICQPPAQQPAPEAPKNAENEPVQAASSIPTIGAVLSTNGTKFPVTKLPELPKDLTSEIGQRGQIPSGGISERPFPETEGRNRPESARQASTGAAGGRGAAVAAPQPAVDKPAADVEKRAQQQAYVVSAWGYAKALLYPEHRFSAEQEQRAMQAILAGVYRHFADAHFDYARYHQGVLRRIELVEKHFTRHAGRYYAPMPWAEMIRGRGYFDWENEKGFRGTMAWLVADQRAEHVSRVNRAVGKAVSELKLRRKLDRGQKTPLRIPKQVQGASYAQLYHQHKAALDQLGGTLATDKFDKLVAGIR